jgi:hypothetical protein
LLLKRRRETSVAKVSVSRATWRSGGRSACCPGSSPSTGRPRADPRRMPATPNGRPGVGSQRSTRGPADDYCDARRRGRCHGPSVGPSVGRNVADPTRPGPSFSPSENYGGCREAFALVLRELGCPLVESAVSVPCDWDRARRAETPLRGSVHEEPGPEASSETSLPNPILPMSIDGIAVLK